MSKDKDTLLLPDHLKYCLWCCRVVLDWRFQTICFPGERMTDMPFPLYAPGLYQVSQLSTSQYLIHAGSCIDGTSSFCLQKSSGSVCLSNNSEGLTVQVASIHWSASSSRPLGVARITPSLRSCALQACKVMSQIGVPLYITETGVPDAKDVLRTEMFTSYFEQARRSRPSWQ